MQAILAAFRNNTCIVRLGIAPHFTNTLALDDDDESDGAAIMTDVQSTRYTEDHLPPFASLGLLVAPNVLLAAGIVPIVWIECLSPTERLANQFVVNRRRGGVRRAPLPDFYIGAHAAIGHLALLTRDPKRYRSYFPKVEILAPTKG